ncbi:MAG: hypothetical protein SNJ71_00160 [Bacteroidales bacterium]
MESTANILRAIIQGEPTQKPSLLLATVKEVTGKFCTVEPVNGDPPITNVRLVADDQKAGVFFKPKKGSLVLCKQITGNDYAVTIFSEIEIIDIKVQKTVSISNDTVSLAGIMNDLLMALQKLTVATAVGPSSPPINSAEFTKIQTDIKKLLK